MNTKVIYYENNKKSCYWRISLCANIFVLFSSITFLYDYKNLVLGTWSIESDKKICTNNAFNVDLIDRYIPCRTSFSVFECAWRFVENVNCPSDDSTVNCLFLGDLSSYRGLPTPQSLETRASTVALTHYLPDYCSASKSKYCVGKIAKLFCVLSICYWIIYFDSWWFTSEFWIMFGSPKEWVTYFEDYCVRS